MIKPFFWLLLLIALVLPITGVAADQATVFVYHRFGDSRYPSTNIAVDVFAQQLAYLKEHRYQVMTLGDIVALLEAGEALPERCVALTVDDGYESFLTGAMPLLRQYQFPATLFVNTDAVGGKSYLDWAQLKALQDEGIEIGNHSASHPYFVSQQVKMESAAWQQWVRQDIEKAQQLFSRFLGQQPQLFAYPYGEYSPELINEIRLLGFKAAAAQQSGVITSAALRYALPRFPMGGGYATFEGFRNKLAMHAMTVTVISPSGPLLGEQDPPVLQFKLDGDEIELATLRCYVQGQETVLARQVDAEAGLFEVVGTQPLQGRRNKYTLTAQGRKGGWYWFSQLWIHP
jgi:peptidoglycan/xylan/chitin deacetylase (PgdA/CDA1 family)